MRKSLMVALTVIETSATIALILVPAIKSAVSNIDAAKVEIAYISEKV